MVPKSNVIKAYLRLYSREQIESALSQALADHAAGVKITNHSWDGSSTGAQIVGAPETLIETLELCLQALDNGGTVPRRNVMVMSDFSRAGNGGF